MSGKASIMEYEHNFEVQIKELEDEQLIDILKKRKLYQNEAANAAIREAIKRDIISSEEDLHSHKFRHEPLKPRIFPLIENPTHKDRIRRSIGRGLLLAGILPVVWGMVRLNTNVPAEGSVLIVFGLMWMFFSAWLIREFSHAAVNFLFIMAALSLVYVIRQMILIPKIIFMDYFIIVILYALAVYGLFFILRLKN